MKTVNVVKISGNLTKPIAVCEPKGSNAGLGNFLGVSIAHSASYRGEDGEWLKTKPAFYSLIVKDEALKQEFLQGDIRKGDHIVIEGRLSQNRESGETYVVVSQLEEFDHCQNHSLATKEIPHDQKSSFQTFGGTESKA